MDRVMTKTRISFNGDLGWFLFNKFKIFVYRAQVRHNVQSAFYELNIVHLARKLFSITVVLFQHCWECIAIIISVTE